MFTINRNVSNLIPYYEQGLFTDVVLVASNVHFLAHKLMLASSSSFFHSMFTNSFKKPGDIITIPDITAETMRLYLQLIYGKEIVTSDCRVAISLLKFMDYTQTTIPNLDKILSTRVKPEDAQEYLHGLIALYRGDIPLDVIKWLDCSKVDFSEFGADGEKYIRSILSNIHIASETAFHIVKTAVKSGFSPSLFSLVQLGYMSPEEILREAPEAEPYIKKVDRTRLTRDLIDTVRYYPTSPIVFLSKSYSNYKRVNVEDGLGQRVELFFDQDPPGVEINSMIKVTKYHAAYGRIYVESYTLLN